MSIRSFHPVVRKVWRIGPMGYSGRAENILLAVGALGIVLSDLGIAAARGAALSRVQAVLRS